MGGDRVKAESNQVTEQQLDEAIRDKASTIKTLQFVSDENALPMQKQDQLKHKNEEADSKIPRPSADPYIPSPHQVKIFLQLLLCYTGDLDKIRQASPDFAELLKSEELLHVIVQHTKYLVNNERWKRKSWRSRSKIKDDLSSIKSKLEALENHSQEQNNRLEKFQQLEQSWIQKDKDLESLISFKNS